MRARLLNRVPVIYQNWHNPNRPGRARLREGSLLIHPINAAIVTDRSSPVVKRGPLSRLLLSLEAEVDGKQILIQLNPEHARQLYELLKQSLEPENPNIV